jgi:hypothetical protein
VAPMTADRQHMPCGSRACLKMHEHNPISLFLCVAYGVCSVERAKRRHAAPLFQRRPAGEPQRLPQGIVNRYGCWVHDLGGEADRSCPSCQLVAGTKELSGNVLLPYWLYPI